MVRLLSYLTLLIFPSAAKSSALDLTDDKQSRHYKEREAYPETDQRGTRQPRPETRRSSCHPYDRAAEIGNSEADYVSENEALQSRHFGHPIYEAAHVIQLFQR
jgi:hypothetical protein